MEHFEPLNASGNNSAAELWPSEISTLRISLWISPYGILPRKFRHIDNSGVPASSPAVGITYRHKKRKRALPIFKLDEAHAATRKRKSCS